MLLDVEILSCVLSASAFVVEAVYKFQILRGASVKSDVEY